MDMFSVIFENSLEHEVASRPASIIDNRSSGKDFIADRKSQITTPLSWAELDYNLELVKKQFYERIAQVKHKFSTRLIS